MYTFLFTTIDGVRGFENYSEDHWLMGISLTNPIETEQDKIKKLTYCVKQLQPSSHKIQDLKKIDNWFIEGDFEPNKPLTAFTPRLIALGIMLASSSFSSF